MYIKDRHLPKRLYRTKNTLTTKKSKRWYNAYSKGPMDIKWMLAYIFMSMGTAKHEKEAIFQRKMCEFRMLRDFESMKCEKITKL